MKNKNMVEVWGDNVSPISLLFAIIISVVTTMGAYFLAPQGDKTLGLFFGLGGAIVGVIICALLFKPKRVFEVEESE
ncbi:MAG: hypothetical protein GX760_05190 [Erysipelothrix sp.]|nr:hypothetical protein [Erysipelothrix sp.]